MSSACDRFWRRSRPCLSDDRLPAGYVEAVTRALRGEADTLHLLIMDLHREINRLQSRIGEQTIDGATAYGLLSDDVPRVRAFMRGLNTTAHLKFDHPGLATTATRDRDRLVIENDLGTTDAHVLVLHVIGLRLSLTYTDVHGQRAQFLEEMLAPAGLEWSTAAASGASYVTCIGGRNCAGLDELEKALALVGSRLVFLIDWNRARKRLGRFLSRAGAIAALK